MLKNYFRAALRNLYRQRGVSFINLLGLTIGLAVAIVLFLYVIEEYSFDQSFDHGERVTRIVQMKEMNQGEVEHLSFIPAALGPAMQAEIPEVEYAARIQFSGESVVKCDDEIYSETNVCFAEQALFNILSYRWIAGNRETALSEPGQVVLTRSTAEKYFGDSDPIGQHLQVNDEYEVAVSGVINDPPVTTHLQFSMLISFPTLENSPNWRWMQRSHAAVVTYVLLDDVANLARVEETLNGFYLQHVPDLDVVHMYLQPLHDIHLHSDNIRYDYIETNSSARKVLLFAGLGVAVLLLACINFMNLATARAILRAKEVGVRKMIGATRKQLFFQYMMESVLYALLAFPFSIILAELVLPLFDTITGSEIHLHVWNNVYLIAATLGIVLMSGLVSGIYPAIMLSAFRPLAVVKKWIPGIGNDAAIRRGLTVLQFAVSMILLIVVGMIQSQIHYLQSQPLGFDDSSTLVLSMDQNEAMTNSDLLREELESDPAVVQTTRSFLLPGWYTGFNHIYPDGYEGEQPLIVNMNLIDDRFIETMGMDILDGRSFSMDHQTDIGTVIVNEAAMNYFGWDSIEGKNIRRQRSERLQPVVGLVRDYHFSSLHNVVEPQILIYYPAPPGGFLSVKLNTPEIAETLERIEQVWTRINPNVPFDYSFLEEGRAQWYIDEERSERLVMILAVLAVFIAALGMVGLATFSMERRQKEIGVRKVLGASIGHLYYVLTREYMILLMIASLIAWPIAYFASNKWLENFAFQTPMNWWLYGAAVLVTILVVLMSISYQTMKTTTVNPAKILRDE